MDEFDQKDINKISNSSYYNNYQILENFRIRKKQLYSFNPITNYYLRQFLKKFSTNKSPKKGNQRRSFVKALSKKNNLREKRFEFTLQKYIESAKYSGAKKLFIFSHPHKNHILENPSISYDVNVKDIIDRVLSENKKDFQGNFEVYHKYISLPNEINNDQEMRVIFFGWR